MAKLLDWASSDQLGLDEPTAGHNRAVATCPFVFLGFMKRTNAASDWLIRHGLETTRKFVVEGLNDKT